MYGNVITLFESRRDDGRAPRSSTAAHTRYRAAGPTHSFCQLTRAPHAQRGPTARRARAHTVFGLSTVGLSTVPMRPPCSAKPGRTCAPSGLASDDACAPRCVISPDKHQAHENVAEESPVGTAQ